MNKFVDIIKQYVKNSKTGANPTLRRSLSEEESHDMKVKIDDAALDLDQEFTSINNSLDDMNRLDVNSLDVNSLRDMKVEIDDNESLLNIFWKDLRENIKNRISVLNLSTKLSDRMIKDSKLYDKMLEKMKEVFDTEKRVIKKNIEEINKKKKEANQALDLAKGKKIKEIEKVADQAKLNAARAYILDYPTIDLLKKKRESGINLSIDQSKLLIKYEALTKLKNEYEKLMQLKKKYEESMQQAKNSDNRNQLKDKIQEKEKEIDEKKKAINEKKYDIDELIKDVQKKPQQINKNSEEKQSQISKVESQYNLSMIDSKGGSRKKLKRKKSKRKKTRRKKSKRKKTRRKYKRRK